MIIACASLVPRFDCIYLHACAGIAMALAQSDCSDPHCDLRDMSSLVASELRHI